jgi:hypothetical protein
MDNESHCVSINKKSVLKFCGPYKTPSTGKIRENIVADTRKKVKRALK